jgi:hypothetical protein
MTEITLRADDQLVSELQAIAKRESATIEEIAHEALDSYVRAHRQAGPGRYSFIGIGHSGQHDLSSRADEILDASADRREGWSLPK